MQVRQSVLSKQSKMISNFLFHRVSPQREILWDPIDTKLFELCIKYISNHYDIRLMEEVAFADKPSKKR